MAFSYQETRIVKGMLLRRDKQHDIAAYFGVNGGRVAEVQKGHCSYPNAPPAPIEELPPPGPYLSKYPMTAVFEALEDALKAIDIADGAVVDQDAKAGLALAREAIQTKIATLREV